MVKTKMEKRHFRAGLEAMLEWLEPEVVLVYGSTPDDVFGDYWKCSEFVKYPDWTSYRRRDEGQAQPEERLRKPGARGSPWAAARAAYTIIPMGMRLTACKLPSGRWMAK